MPAHTRASARRRDATSPADLPSGSARDEDLQAIGNLERAWLQRCQATGCANGPFDEHERFDLLAALEGAATADAVTRVRGTFASQGRGGSAPRPAASVPARRKALEKAAAAWGTRVGTPLLVVEQLVLLRHLVAPADDGDRLGRLVN
ncbi:MAG: hypothetical protein ACRD0B_12010, partial [Acidimicrobiales bacterium]